VLANFPFSDEFWWLRPEQQTDDKKKSGARPFASVLVDGK